LKIIIPGTPIPKMRHRTYLRGRTVQTFDPQSAEKNNTKTLIKGLIQNNYDIKKYCAFTLKIDFYFAYPKEYCEWIEPIHNRTPDYSNCLKYYEDCANEILYEDDKQIVEIYGKKLYSNEPRTEIEIMPIEIPTLHAKVEKILRVFSPSELEAMLQDFITLSYVYGKINDTDNASVYALQLTEVATQLSEIAIKYTEKLSKLKKIGDIQTLDAPHNNSPGENINKID
jgi:Holliday junction resolvase RusA-like endonuclease